MSVNTQLQLYSGTGGTSAGVYRLDSASYPKVTLMATNIAGAEYVDVQILGVDETLITVAAWDGRAHAIDATNGAVTVPGGPVYVLTKSATASPSVLSFSPSKYF